MAATKKQIKDFIEKMVPIAKEQAKKHGNQIYVSVCIAQAAHESGWGTSKKMVEANALFGIKVGKSAYKFGKAWKGAAYKTGTTEYYDGKNPTKIVDWFRKYDSIEDATEDYFDMLCHCNRYKPALNRKTPEECIEAIIAGGYATGPAYVERIKTIINQYNLKQYDGSLVLIQEPVKEKLTSTYVPGKVYSLKVNLYVREEPNGDKKKLIDITNNARLHAISDEKGCAILKNGTKVTCKESKVIGNSIWIRIPSGWVCAVPANGNTYIS